jgi:hypothetical protein
MRIKGKRKYFIKWVYPLDQMGGQRGEGRREKRERRERRKGGGRGGRREGVLKKKGTENFFLPFFLGLAYFMKNIKEYCTYSYVPTDEDKLRNRIKTTGILEVSQFLGVVTGVFFF